MDRVHDVGHAGYLRGEAAKNAGLGTVCVNDVESLPSEQSHQLNERQGVSPGVDFAHEVRQHTDDNPP